MLSVSINEIRKELRTLDAEQLVEFCLRLAKYKKENKELLTYLMYQAHDERGFVGDVKSELEKQFNELTQGNVYYVKKSLRRILRFLNRQVKYSSLAVTELELRIYFCTLMKKKASSAFTNSVVNNLFQQQMKKVTSILEKLPEDLYADYAHDLEMLA